MACLESAVFSIDLDDDNIIYQEGGGGKEDELRIASHTMPGQNRLSLPKPTDSKFNTMGPSRNIQNATETPAKLKLLKPQRAVPTKPPPTASAPTPAEPTTPGAEPTAPAPTTPPPVIPPSPAKSPPPPPGGLKEDFSLKNVAKELFDTEHTYVHNLELITNHLERYKNDGIQIIRQKIVINSILERALGYLIRMYQIHKFSYIGTKEQVKKLRDEDKLKQKNKYVNSFLTLEESKNEDAFNWLRNIKEDEVKELYIKYNFILDFLNESDDISGNELDISGSDQRLNSFLIKPPQRFMRYPMLFDEIIKYANDKDKSKFQTHQLRLKNMLTDINDFKIYFTKTKFETLYEEGQKFINTHFPNGLYSFPFHLYDVITADDEEKINAESSELDNSKLALSADDEKKINAEIFAKQTKVENMKNDFLEIICNGVLASSIIKGKVNESKCKTKTNHKTMFYDIRAAHTDLQKQLKELETSNDESLFEVYIREVNKKVTGNGCQDILMKLIVLEQASTIYIARCIKSKYPTVLFSYRKDSKFSGLWEKDKKLLQEDKIRTVKKGGGKTYIDNPEISGRPKDVGVEDTKSNNQFAEKQFIEMEKKFLTPPEGDPRKPPDNNLLKGLQNYPDPNQDLIDNYEKEHGAYKKNSMVYQLIKEQMKVNKEILGFQPEITNLDAMFDFKKIDQIVDDFDTSKMDQKILSKYFDESVQLKHAMDVEVLKQLMEQAEYYFKDKLQNQDEHKKMIHGIIKNHKNFLVTEFNKKDLKINHSILYATDNNREKLFQTCMPSILNH